MRELNIMVSFLQNGQLQRERRSILEAVRSNMFHHPAAADGVGYQPARPSEQILSTELLPSLACILNPHVRLVGTDPCPLICFFE